MFSGWGSPVQMIFWWGHGLNRMRTTAVEDFSLTNVYQLCIKIIQTSQSLKGLDLGLSDMVVSMRVCVLTSLCHWVRKLCLFLNGELMTDLAPLPFSAWWDTLGVEPLFFPVWWDMPSWAGKIIGCCFFYRNNLHNVNIVWTQLDKVLILVKHIKQNYLIESLYFYERAQTIKIKAIMKYKCTQTFCFWWTGRGFLGCERCSDFTFRTYLRLVERWYFLFNSRRCSLFSLFSRSRPMFFHWIGAAPFWITLTLWLWNIVCKKIFFFLSHENFIQQFRFFNSIL